MSNQQDRINATIIGISLAVIAVFAVVFVARFVFGGPEDDWICVRGQWVMHGKPAVPKPTTACIPAK